jgi:hypothetical protein
MSGTVARRNDPGYWAAPIKWTRISRKRPPRCVDCWQNLYDTGDVTLTHITRATWTRHSGVRNDDPDMDTKIVVDLCADHRQEWLDWTPGQQVLA